MLEPLGVTSVRACSARQAERVIRTTQIHVAVVDLSIPLDSSRSSSPHAASNAAPHAAAHAHHDEDASEGGGRVLELLRRLDSPPPTVILKAPHFARDEARSMRAALACDAFAVVDRAAADAELMLQVLQRCLERFYRGRWPGSAPGSGSAPGLGSGPGPNITPGGRV
jgi:CheY-like chemotaxis protein